MGYMLWVREYQGLCFERTDMKWLNNLLDLWLRLNGHIRNTWIVWVRRPLRSCRPPTRCPGADRLLGVVEVILMG